MTWGNSWSQPVEPAPTFANAIPINPWDKLSQDELLVLWDAKKKALADAKAEEMEMRKYIVGRAFPNKTEGTNTLELGNGYALKAGVQYNYKLLDNKIVEDCLDRIALTGNQGAFIAERLVSWSPSFLVTEYRVLQDEVKEGSDVAKQILAIVNEMLVIEDAAPTLEIKEPKVKKK